MVALTVQGLDVWYGRVQVCFGVDLEVPDGSVCALVGTNGAGKSTVLRAVAGLVRPSRGTVRFFDEEVTGLSTEARVRRGMVSVAGGRATFPSLTGVRLVFAGMLKFVVRCPLPNLTSWSSPPTDEA